MANFSSFFPSAGGGGGGIGQTITVGDYSYPNAISIDDFADSLVSLIDTSNYHINASHPSSSSPTFVESNSSAHNTYETLLNITSATNGGALYFLGSRFQRATNNDIETKWRVTIDGGTPTVITDPYQSPSVARATMIGHGWELAGGYNSSTGKSYSANRVLPHSNSANSSVYNSYANNAYYNKRNFSAYYTSVSVFPAEYCSAIGVPYVYFSSSLLIEFLTDQASNYSYNYIQAAYKTF